MRKKNILKPIALLSSMLLIGSAFGQEIPDNDHVFELQYGPHMAVLHDDAFSILNQSGTSFGNIGIDYTHEHEKRFFYASFQLDQYKLEGYEPYEFIPWNSDEPRIADNSYHTYLNLQLKWSLTHEPFEVGVLNSNTFISSNWVFGNAGTFGYFGMYGAGAYATYRYSHKNIFSFSGSLNLPILAWVAHSPYAANDDEYIYNNRKHSPAHAFLSMTADGGLATFNRLQQFDLVLDGAYHINEEWSVGLNYQFSFLNFNDHGNYRLAQNMVSLTGTYRLSR